MTEKAFTMQVNMGLQIIRPISFNIISLLTRFTLQLTIFGQWVIDNVLVCFQNPNEDTEWNDVLRQKGIIPEKEKGITEEDIIRMMEKTIEDKQKSSK